MTSADDLHIADRDGAVRAQHDLAGAVARLLDLTEREWSKVPRGRHENLPVPCTAGQPTDFAAWGAVVAARRRRIAEVGDAVPDVGAVEVDVLGDATLHDHATAGGAAQWTAPLPEGSAGAQALEGHVDQDGTFSDDGWGDDRRPFDVRPWREREPVVRSADELLTRGDRHV